MWYFCSRTTNCFESSLKDEIHNNTKHHTNAKFSSFCDCIRVYTIWNAKTFWMYNCIDTWTAVAQWLRCCVTNRKTTGSIPAGVIGFFIYMKPFRLHYGSGVESASKSSTRCSKRFPSFMFPKQILVVRPTFPLHLKASHVPSIPLSLIWSFV